MKTIYSYDDHRKFLGDWYFEKKESTSGFSFQRFSQLAKLSSPNYMKLVIAGKRNLTVTNIHQVATGLKLNFDESQYFEAITCFTQSKTENERKYFRKRIKQLRETKPKRAGTVKGTDLITQWFFPAVVVCLDNTPMAHAVQLVSKKTGLDKKQVEMVIAMMRAKNLLVEFEGNYRVEYSHFIAEDKPASSEGSKNFLREQLKVSQNALEKSYRRGAKFISHTFTVGEGELSKYAEKIETLIEELTCLSNEEKPDRVLQLNVQLFDWLHRV